MKMEYDPDRAYADVIIRRRGFVQEDYLNVPIIGWLHKNVGPLLTKSVGEITHGDGWEIYVDWQNFDWQNVKTYVIITKDVDQSLVTKFWMKFGK